MDQSIRVYTKKARADAPGTMVGVRLQPDELSLVDAWIVANGGMSRPEAVRRLIKAALSA